MKTVTNVLALGALVAATLVGSAGADVVRSPSGLSGGATLEDFETTSIGVVPNGWRAGGITFSSPTGLAVTTISGYGANGTAVTNRVLQAVATTSVGPGVQYGSMDLTFDAPVKEVLLGWFDPNFEGNMLEAYDSNGILLESAAVDLGPVGGSHAAWIGFKRANADIKRVRMVDPSGDDVYAVDNIQTVVPAPGACMALAAAGGCAVRRRRR